MIFVRGVDSEIVKALNRIYPVTGIKRGYPMPPAERRYLFCVGKLEQKNIRYQTEEEIAETFWVNTAQVIRECDWLLENNPCARICVVGSDSGFKGSFDATYAAAKAGLHNYVNTKRLNHPHQQLVCVAPSMVSGTRMNMRRNIDGKIALDKRLKAHPKGRMVTTLEVARLIHFLLCVDEGFTSGVTIRMNGGEHCQNRH
jgi:NAD(P)-dependent dehydrogenase (short-subunit alcohol dehydrogenase family)